VVDIRVDEKVKTAMNEINAAKRLREVGGKRSPHVLHLSLPTA
jgi:hypothetical protein